MGKIPCNQLAPENLIDAGCNTALVERFFELQILGWSNEQFTLLAAHRRVLLEEIHELQKRLDCLDYLLYQMKKGNIS